MKRNRAQRIQKYFCCAACFGDLIDVEKNGKLDLECRLCGCQVFVTKTTADIKIQKSLAKEKEIRHKTQVFEIKPWYLDQSIEQSLAELGF